MKAPLDNGTPRQHRHGNFVGLVHRGHVATCEKKLFLAARSTAASFGGLSRRVRSAAGWLSQPLLIVHIGVCRVATKSLATRSRPRSFLRTPDRTQYFLLYCGTFPEAAFSEMVVELRDPVSRRRFFWEASLPRRPWRLRQRGSAQSCRPSRKTRTQALSCSRSKLLYAAAYA